MGILGLLQFIKASLKERKLSDYRGKTVAVDTYAWLQSAYAGSTKSSRGQAENSSFSEEPIATST
jgi:hypothetical protein